MSRLAPRRALVALAIALSLARGADAQEGLEALLTGIEGAREVPGAAVALAELADGKAELLFEPLVARPELTRMQRTALELALESMPREAVLSPLRGVARRPGAGGERETALGLLARMGLRGDLSLALELGAADARNEGAPRDRQKALELCLVSILRRDASAVQLLCELLTRAEASTLAPSLRALADAGGPEAAARMAGLLPLTDDGTRALLLTEIGRLAGRGHGLDDLGVSDLVRVQLGNRERSLVVLACGVLEKLRDHSAVPELIVLLGDDDANVRARAHTTLRRLTGLELPPQEEPWLAWLDDAMGWWDTRSETCRVALVSGSAAEAALAINELAQQRFRRDHVVQALELALARTEVDLVEVALAALGALDEPRAQLALQRFREEVRDELRPSLERARLRIDQRVAAPGPRKTIRTPQRTRNP